MAKNAENKPAQETAETKGVKKKIVTKRPRSPKKLLEEAKEIVSQKRPNNSKNNRNKSTKPRKKKSPTVKEISAEEAAQIEEEKARILSRRNLVFELKKAGASYRQISEHLKNKGIEGASVGQVHADYQFMLAEAADNLSLSVEEYVESEIALLDEIQFTFFPDMKRDKNIDMEDRAKAASIILQCMKERAKLRNLYKPIKIQLDPDEELAKLLNISKEELPTLEQSPES